MDIIYREETPVTVLCGHLGEQWAAVEMPAGDGQVAVEVVKLTTLSSPDGYAELYNHIDSTRSEYELEFAEHLPLSVEGLSGQSPGASLRVLTCNGETLYETTPRDDHYDAFRADPSSDAVEDAATAADTTLSTLRALQMAYESPHRFLFEHQSNLLSVDA